MMSHQLGYKRRDDEYYDASNEHHNGAAIAALPFFQDDAPNIGENHVERHQDAERKGEERWRGRQEALA